MLLLLHVLVATGFHHGALQHRFRAAPVSRTVQMLRPRVQMAAEPVAVPTLREQMQAYLKSVKERGVDLNAQQLEMIKEMEAEEALLDIEGRPDFLAGAEILSSDDFGEEGKLERLKASVRAQEGFFGEGTAPMDSTTPVELDPATGKPVGGGTPASFGSPGYGEGEPP